MSVQPILIQAGGQQLIALVIGGRCGPRISKAVVFEI